MNRLAFAALCALAAVLAALLCVAVAVAGERAGDQWERVTPIPAPVIPTPAASCEGQLQPRPLPSFWCVAPGERVYVQGGQWGLNEAEGGTWVLWAQGQWGAVAIGDQTVAGEWRTWLPEVTR